MQLLLLQLQAGTRRPPLRQAERARVCHNSTLRCLRLVFLSAPILNLTRPAPAVTLTAFRPFPFSLPSFVVSVLRLTSAAEQRDDISPQSASHPETDKRGGGGLSENGRRTVVRFLLRPWENNVRNLLRLFATCSFTEAAALSLDLKMHGTLPLFYFCISETERLISSPRVDIFRTFLKTLARRKTRRTDRRGDFHSGARD